MHYGFTHLKHILASTIRHFKRRFLYSSLNTLGLTLAYITVILTFAYVYFETHYDRYHEKSDRICRVTYAFSSQDFHVHWARVPADWINHLPSDIPEIEKLIRFQNQEQKYIRVGEDRFKPQNGFVTDNEIFEVFDLDLISGDKNALNDPFSVVITESTARRYFSNTAVIGRELFVSGNWTDEEQPYKVTGVIRDLPANTHIPIDLLFSFASEEERTDWAYVYVLLHDGVDVNKLQAKTPQFIAKYLDEDARSGISLTFQPLHSIHLESDLAREIEPNSSWFYVKIFIWVGLFIWLIALVNFTNLITAIMLERSREMGVRKILGARSSGLVQQTILETTGFSILSMLLASGLVALVWPYYVANTGVTTVPPWQISISFLMAIAVLTGIIAGIYPAITTMSSNILQNLRYNKVWSPATGNNASRFKLSLISLQFCATILLMVSALVGREQIRFVREKNLGMTRDQIIAMPDVPDPVKKDFPVFRQLMKEVPGVQEVSACMEVPSREIRDSGPVLITGKNQDKSQAPLLDMQVIDPRFTKLMDMNILAGQDFVGDPLPGNMPAFSDELTPQDYLLDQPRKYLVNETGMRKLGYEDAQDILGEEISWSIGSFQLASGPVVGVVQDFHQETLKNRVDPLVMVVEPIWLNTFLVKVSTDQIEQTIAQMEDIWKSRYPYVLEYYFLDELYNELYKSEVVQLSQLSVLALLAIIVSFIGLASMIAYSLETRKKEIAIRRVVGASLISIITLLGKSYLWVILIAAFIAVPLSYYGVSLWLEEFAYHIQIPVGSYVLVLMIIFVLLTAILLLQTFRSQQTNPVNTLRDE